MTGLGHLKAALIAGAGLLALVPAAQADQFNIPSGDLKSALAAYTTQTGVELVVAGEAVKGVRTKGAKGEFTAYAALSHILAGTGFTMQRDESGAVGIVRARKREVVPAGDAAAPIQLAAAAAANVETIVVTSSKIKGDIQTVPIAITALSQEQLTSRQIAGGPDLVKEVPNLTFTKTNFTGYSIQIRGIGTQAISVTTDPAVAVSFNDIPFLRNHFFEQEFFDVAQVEVLRGPQGTLYGRNATAGVVNVISAKPTDHFEAQASADWGNYSNRRYEGMVNIPIWSDKLDLRVAGEWTKRDGYAYNEQTHHSIDGRDLWSSRISLLVHPLDDVTATLIWEHFQEDDNRARSTKQLCKRADAPAVVDGYAGPIVPNNTTNFGAVYLAQGCQMVSLYSPQAFETPNASAIPFIQALGLLTPFLPRFTDPYAGATQSHNLRVISSLIDPIYKAKNDTFEANIDIDLGSGLTLTSQTGYNKDRLYSTEDFNRYNTVANLWADPGGSNTLVGQDGQYCDPQLGCSTRFVAQDVSQENARQFYQEVRLASSFKGPVNFVAGANYMNYKTHEEYYVFSNAISLAAERFNTLLGRVRVADAPHIPFDPTAANACGPQPADPGAVYSSLAGLGCEWIDPNPLGHTDGQGHNYFLSNNPYRLKSWAAFGEVNYQVEPDVKLTGGLRYTDDKKSFDEYPSWTFLPGKGIPYQGTVDQEWREWTGRAVVDWTPKLDFTDQTLVYGSYAHGYKGGGANPPGVTTLYRSDGPLLTSPSNATHPLTFKPEFNDAFEIGTKNTLMDGAMTLNGDIFLYKYSNYQISQIVDRTSVNLNFDATVRGAELEAGWEPVPGLKFNFAGGYENATINNGQSAIDLMDRTAGHAGWMVVKPAITATSNCILPTYVVNQILTSYSITSACIAAYTKGFFVDNSYADPVTERAYTAYPATDLNGRAITDGYPGFDSTTAPNNGEGFAKDVGGNQLPNAPHFTVSLTGDYTVPLSDDWAGTVHADFYWQSQSWARVFNDRPYDKLRGYSTTNLALILTNSDGWQVMGYVKNIFNKTAITGAFLNSDDSALTTNVFVTDPRLIGVRITKTF